MINYSALAPSPANCLITPSLSQLSVHVGSISESTRLSDSSAEPSRGQELSTENYGRHEIHPSPICEVTTLSGYPPYGYTRILPRTNSTSGIFTKQCETCGSCHDGSFGAGRFCSSRCARTVGGLAHRKKRMLERGMKARCVAESRARAKKNEAVAKEFVEAWRRKGRNLAELSRSGSVKSYEIAVPSIIDRGSVERKSTSRESNLAMMRIGSILNPDEG